MYAKNLRRILCIIAAAIFILLTACTAPPDSSGEKTQIGTVTFEVNAKNAVAWGKDNLPEGGALYPAQSVPLYEGESVMAILLRILPDQVDKQGSYVAGICSLRERDCGAASGWYYYVNGEAPQMSTAKWQPQDGDVIRFLYTVKGGDIPY
ncbi:MAG: DUF4430 domain-containing protein [Oscillospiraceae bacterium]|jgi:hypothetical protein|nr:DUF4430 domain-containing protein [Oscillospiraceae bacterium]